MEPPPAQRGNRWNHAQVEANLKPRSYVVSTPGIYRRYRIQLRQSDVLPPATLGTEHTPIGELCDNSPPTSLPDLSVDDNEVTIATKNYYNRVPDMMTEISPKSG